MLNSAFDGVGATAGDFYPADLREEIDALNARIYPTVNNGVYRCGFARSQAAYDEAVAALFDSLDWLEARLAERRYLCGERATEADWRLFTTLVRFDPVYVGLFKCNLRRIADYPNLSRYLAASARLAGRRGDDRLLPHQASLLREPEVHQSDRHRAARPGGIRVNPNLPRRVERPLNVTPRKRGSSACRGRRMRKGWIPACAGMTARLVTCRTDASAYGVKPGHDGGR